MNGLKSILHNPMRHRFQLRVLNRRWAFRSTSTVSALDASYTS
jgi:hypothetical protein